MAGLGVDPYTLGQLATCRDNAGDLNGCRRFRRWAMTSDPTSEHLVSAWIADERRSADGFTGHDFLWERHRKWSQLERGPSLTLLDTLRADEKHDEADALEAELDRRFPNDPDIVFHKADRWIGTDKQAQVAALLDGLETGGHAGRLARARADLFRSEGRFSEAIAVVNQRLEEEPLALDLIDRLFGYHATFHGRERAIACSKDLVDRFPEHMGLRHRYCSWLSQRPADKAEALGAILIRDPEDAWTIRELAWTRFNLGQTAEAERLLGEASALDPDSIGTLNLAADLAMRAGDRETARAKLRAVQDLDLDLHWSNERLLDLPTGRQDLIAELDHFADALATRHHDGDALRLWFSTARATFDPADFEQRLTRLAESCADHWQMSQLHAIWLRTRDRLDEAAAVLAAARKRWPEAVVFLNDAAAVAKAQGRREEEEGLLKEAMRLAPSWTAPLRRLAEMRLEADDQKAAEALIERARRIDPRIADNHRLAGSGPDPGR
jgi:tetratricopeptide (TPR) repeat protein